MMRARPTPERIRQAQGGFELGQDARGKSTTLTMLGPFERAHRREAITDGQYAAGQKYRHHWFRAGLSGGMSGVDLDRVFCTDPGAFSGMARTEAQVFHRQQYRAAVQELGLINAAVVEAIVCREQNLAEVGFTLAWKRERSAEKAAIKILGCGLDRLCKLWGI